MARNLYKIARRSIWYVLRTLVIVTGAVALCLAVFIEGMHVSNLYILVTEGMEARAEVIFKSGAPLELTTYFTEEFISNDAALYRDDYEGFTVASFDYRVDVRGFFVLPWSQRATMVVDDKLAALNAALNDEAIKTSMRNLGVEPAPGRADAFDAYIKSETTKWGKVIKQANIRLDQ